MPRVTIALLMLTMAVMLTLFAGQDQPARRT